MGDEGGMTRGDGGSQRERERNERERSKGRGEEGREGALKNIPESPQHPDQTPAGEEKVWRFHSSDPLLPANFTAPQKMRRKSAKRPRSELFPRLLI